MGQHGWPFANVDAFPGADVDPIMNAEHLKDIYLNVQPDYDGKKVEFMILYSLRLTISFQVYCPRALRQEAEGDREQRVIRNHKDT